MSIIIDCQSSVLRYWVVHKLSLIADEHSENPWVGWRHYKHLSHCFSIDEYNVDKINTGQYGRSASWSELAVRPFTLKSPKDRLLSWNGNNNNKYTNSTNQPETSELVK